MERKALSIFGASFLDGFSLAGFLTPLRRPGAPTRVFAEEPIVSSKEELELAGKVFQRAGFEVQLKRATSTR
jgi:uncharacterized protein YbbC (DUF1343 family)